MIIGFTHKTSKILPKIFCKKFRHCAIVLVWGVECGVWNYIFIHKIKKRIQILELTSRDLKILEQNGWVFIKVKREKRIDKRYNNTVSFISYLLTFNSTTCVGLVKRALGIRNIFIQTPDSLYKFIVRYP